MNKTIALALVAASLAAFPLATPSFAVDTANSALCGPDAPEGYKRPGGFCDQLNEKGSLIHDEDDDCTYILTRLGIELLTEEVQVAEYCDFGGPWAV